MDLSALEQSGLFARIEWHSEIDSTNTRALGLCSQRELPTPTLVAAERQTAGRGRGGNRWWTGAGALTFSLVLEPAKDFVSPGTSGLDASHWPRLSLAAAVALCEVIADRGFRDPPRLKWPNDVHLAGRKVAGILVEVPPPAPSTPRRLVLGMGVNVNNSLADAPPEIQQSAVSLIDLQGEPLDRQQLLCDWMVRFHEHAAALAVDSPELGDLWRSFCLLAGQRVSLQSGERQITGFCLGIDDHGALLIDTPEGTERCYGGVLVRIEGG